MWMQKSHFKFSRKNWRYFWFFLGNVFYFYSVQQEEEGLQAVMDYLYNKDILNINLVPIPILFMHLYFNIVYHCA